MTAFNHTHVASRELQLSTPGMPASDGDGVKMTRIIGTPAVKHAGSIPLARCLW